MLKGDSEDKKDEKIEEVIVEHVLGIHSNVGSGAGFMDGHAWITVTTFGFTKTYGLWPDSHPRTKDNGKGSDVRIDMEPSTSIFNRYYLLTDLKKIQLMMLIKTTDHWFYTNNCSSWASAIVWKLFRVDIDADDFLGVETPRELGKNIQILELKEPTTLKNPKIIGKK